MRGGLVDSVWNVCHNDQYSPKAKLANSAKDSVLSVSYLVPPDLRYAYMYSASKAQYERGVPG